MGNQKAVLFTKKDTVRYTGTHLLLAMLGTGCINFFKNGKDALQAAAKTTHATLRAIFHAPIIHQFTIVGFGYQHLSLGTIRKGLKR